MKYVVSAIGSEMGFLDKGNDKEYLDIIRAELRIDLRMMEMALVAFYSKYPFDTTLGFSVEEVREYRPEYVRAPIYENSQEQTP